MEDREKIIAFAIMAIDAKKKKRRMKKTRQPSIKFPLAFTAFLTVLTMTLVFLAIYYKK